MSASLFEIKKQPMSEPPKKRKQRSDKGKTRKNKGLDNRGANRLPDEKTDATTERNSIDQPKLDSTIGVCDREGDRVLRSWEGLARQLSKTGFAIPAIGSLTITAYLVHQGYNYLLASNDWISALTTSVAAEAVMLCAAAAHAFSKGVSKFLLLVLMCTMIISGGMYMHSSVAAGARGSDEVYKRAVESRNGIAKSLEVARKSVEGIPETYASKRATALQSVTELETKLSDADNSLSLLSPAPAGVTYNLLVRLCAMVMCLILVHISVRNVKET